MKTLNIILIWKLELQNNHLKWYLIPLDQISGFIPRTAGLDLLAGMEIHWNLIHGTILKNLQLIHKMDQAFLWNVLIKIFLVLYLKTLLKLEIWTRQWNLQKLLKLMQVSSKTLMICQLEFLDLDLEMQ